MNEQLSYEKQQDRNFMTSKDKPTRLSEFHRIAAVGDIPKDLLGVAAEDWSIKDTLITTYSPINMTAESVVKIWEGLRGEIHITTGNKPRVVVLLHTAPFGLVASIAEGELPEALTDALRGSWSSPNALATALVKAVALIDYKPTAEASLDVKKMKADRTIGGQVRLKRLKESTMEKLIHALEHNDDELIDELVSLAKSLR